MMEKGYMPYRDSFDHKGPLLYFLNFIGNKCVYTYNVDWTGHDGWNAQCAAPSSCSMVYMTSGDPMNESSWTVRGEYNANPMNFGCMPCNNHTHLQKFKGRWYLIYHNQELQKDLVHDASAEHNLAGSLHLNFFAAHDVGEVGSR